MSQSAGYRLISHHGYAEVRRRLSNDQNALFVTRPFSTGELISDFVSGKISGSVNTENIELRKSTII